MAMATLSLVPTPSALETSTGSFHFLWFRAKSAPKLPMPPRTPGVKVREAWCRMRCLASSATAISTPASAYFMREVIRDPCSVKAGVTNRARAAFQNGVQFYVKKLGIAAAGRGNHWQLHQPSQEKSAGLKPGLYKLKNLRQLKGAEEALPAHRAGMQDGVRIGVEALANMTGLPGILRNIERHIDHDRSADDVVSRDRAPEAAVVRIGPIVAH